MVAYSSNNPIMYIDPSGYISVSIREFVESRGGTVSWNAFFGIAKFKLNGKVLTTGRWGGKNFMIDVRNVDGTMMAEDYELAYLFNLDDWATYLPGFRWYDGSSGDEGDQGFEVSTIDMFLNKNFCLDFAECIIDMAGTNGQYLGKDKLGIAMECYAHAMGKFLSGISTSIVPTWGDVYWKSSKEIGYVANDENSWAYPIVWYLF